MKILFKKLFEPYIVIPLLGAILVGTLSIAPSLLAPLALGSSYQGYPFIYQDDEDLNLARIQEVVDGHVLIGSPMLYEYKNEWPSLLPSSEYIYALPTIVFGISPKTTVVASKFFLPALLFLILYALVLALLSKPAPPQARLSALAAGLFITLGYDTVDYAHLPGILTNTHLNLLVWTRLVNPIVGGICLFTLLLLLVRIYSTKTRWLFIPAGILLGIMISYFFSWFLGGVCTGLSCLYALYAKDVRLAKQYIGVLVVSAIVQAPYWYHSFMLSGAERISFEMKNGALFTHAPILNKFLLAATGMFVLVSIFEWYQKRSFKKIETWWWMCGGLLLSCWIAFNEQVITGMAVWPYHFVQYTIPLCVVVVTLMGIGVVLPRFPKLWLGALIVLTTLSVVVGIQSARSYTHILGDFASRQAYMPLFSYLNTQAPKDCVVLVDEKEERLARLIPAFTHCNTYTTTYTFSGIPEARVLHNYLVHLRLLGLTPKTVAAYLAANPGEVNVYFFKDYAQLLSGASTPQTLQSIGMIEDAYASFYKQDFFAELTRYRIDYILSASSTLASIPQSISWQKPQTFSSLYLYTVPH